MNDDARLSAVEDAILAAFRSNSEGSRRSGADAADWIAFGLRSLLEASRSLRQSSAGFRSQVKHKADGSAATQLETELERAVRARLASFEPAAAFVGEETGGSLPASGWAVAMDPVDGTWAFLNETGAWSCTLAVFHEGQPFAGFVANPATGEVAYTVAGASARYLRVSAFGEGDFGMTLRRHSPTSGPPLVNLQPTRLAGDVHGALTRAWQRSEIAALRSPGGSPAWSLVEAARGHYVYVNLWSKQPAQPFDLAAGVLLVRSAGGDVTDLDGVPIDAATHAGPWLAALDAAGRARVAALVRAAW